ncbi:MAG: hypothetical protein KAR40_00510 [Candidatus Sabulitectum sp.]|nr:hypothetical protein [Candidatus Sabulitectum sp.]
MTVFPLIAVLVASWSGTFNFDPPGIDASGLPVIEGTVNLNEPGVPMYPVKTVFIPVPPGVEPVLDYTSVNGAFLPVISIPRAGILVGSGLDARTIHVAPVDRSVQTVELDGVFPLAGTQVAVINIYPFTESGPTSSVTVTLDWDEPVAGHGIPENHLLCGVAEGDVYWPLPHNRGSSPFWGKPWARISIEDSGGYEFTCSELEAAGCNAGGSPVESMAFFSGPGTQFAQAQETEHFLQPVSVIVNDKNEDGIFNGDDTIRFLAGGLNRFEYFEKSLQWLYHRYATDRIYWLTWGGESGARMQSKPGVPDGSPQWGNTIPHTVHLEDGGYWMPRYELRTGWFWKKINSGEQTSVPLNLGNAAGTADVTLAFAVSESSAYQVTLQGGGTVELSGSGFEQAVFEDVTVSGLSQLQISFSSTDPSADFYLDYVELTYLVSTTASNRRLFIPEQIGRYNFSFSGGSTAFDVSDLMNPKIISGAEQSSGSLNFSLDLQDSTSLMVTSEGDWNSPSLISPASPGRLVGAISSGDRLMVVPDVFADDAVGLESLMESMGFEVVTATTSEIYDEFGQGVKDPGAIRSAVRWAMDSWSTPVSTVILGGDATYDPLNYSTTLPDLVPAMIFLTNSSSYPSWAEDDWFVQVHADAIYPEIPIARIPAGDASSFGAVSAKSILYHSGQADGSWSNRFVLFADDEWGQSNTSAGESAHIFYMEKICYEDLPSHVKPEKFYLIEFPWPPGTVPGGVHPEKPDARTALRELWNEGMGVMFYFGHGSANQITHEKTMLGDDPASLTNGARLPLAMFLSCDISRFFEPGVDCISEKLVYHPAGGAIATIGATGPTHSSSNYDYGSAMIPFLTENGNSIGYSFWAGKLAASRAGNSKYYVFLGFPDLILPMSSNDLAVELQGDTLRSGEINSVTGNGNSSDGLALIEISESDIPVHYTMLSGGVIDYFHQGGTAWRGRAALSGGEFSAECILPAACNTGDLARVDVTAIVPGGVELGADAPLVLAEGDAPSDFEGPEISMWIRGQSSIEEPTITGEGVLEAELSDPSGITFLGRIGKSIQLFVDNDEYDVSESFTYNTGSTVTGQLEYTVSGLASGRHLFILQAMDGVGNLSRDSLYVNSTEQSEVAIEQYVVYPNPGTGRRCFSFSVSSNAFVTVSVFTTAGRCIVRFSKQCTQGYNQIIWNGLDADGDIPASGAYIYAIEAVTESGLFKQSSSVTGVLATVN